MTMRNLSRLRRTAAENLPSKTTFSSSIWSSSSSSSSFCFGDFSLLFVSFAGSLRQKTSFSPGRFLKQNGGPWSDKDFRPLPWCSDLFSFCCDSRNLIRRGIQTLSSKKQGNNKQSRRG
uniref:Uncharacterized protein n=1 Tax=Leersia perrieri TaxID=77586 RepID=A0A0D9V316_9ORYZ